MRKPITHIGHAPPFLIHQLPSSTLLIRMATVLDVFFEKVFSWAERSGASVVVFRVDSARRWFESRHTPPGSSVAGVCRSLLSEYDALASNEPNMNCSPTMSRTGRIFRISASARVRRPADAFLMKSHKPQFFGINRRKSVILIFCPLLPAFRPLHSHHLRCELSLSGQLLSASSSTRFSKFRFALRLVTCAPFSRPNY